MKLNTTNITFKVLLLLLAASMTVACTETLNDLTDPNAKPFADPDIATTQGGKSDAVTKWYTRIMGELAVGDGVKDTIDYPDWFHGYTLELKGGTTIDFRVQATDDGYVRLYGPSRYDNDGEPAFDHAVARGDTDPDGDYWGVEYTFEVPESGTYMLVYGPKWAWSATYKFEADCVAGCLPDDACESDDACNDDEFCGHNGVNCFAPPCDVSYDICQPRLGEGSWCQRDRVCGDGLVCLDSACRVDPGPGDEQCESHEDCIDGFCGYADNTGQVRVCKPYSPEGGSCGGFVQPSWVTMCSPDFDCVGPQFIADIPGSCGQQVELHDLLANPAKYEGQFVAVEGHIDATVPMCTMMACAPNECCNSCGASQRLFDGPQEWANPDEGLELHQDGQPFACGGNECTYMDNCTVSNGAWWVAGWVRAGEHFGHYLDVTRKYPGITILPVDADGDTE